MKNFKGSMSAPTLLMAKMMENAVCSDVEKAKSFPLKKLFLVGPMVKELELFAVMSTKISQNARLLLTSRKLP